MTRLRLSWPSINAESDAAEGVSSPDSSLPFSSPSGSEVMRSDALLAGNVDLRAAASVGNSNSRIRVLLPEPLTPLIQTNRPRGISTAMALRLCRVARESLRVEQAFGLG